MNTSVLTKGQCKVTNHRQAIVIAPVSFCHFRHIFVPYLTAHSQVRDNFDNWKSFKIDEIFC